MSPAYLGLVSRKVKLIQGDIAGDPSHSSYLRHLYNKDFEQTHDFKDVFLAQDWRGCWQKWQYMVKRTPYIWSVFRRDKETGEILSGDFFLRDLRTFWNGSYLNWE